MNIAVWGTGNVGKYVYGQIKNNRNYLIRCFVDSNSQLWGTRIDGIEVVSPERLQSIFSAELEFVLIAFKKGISIYKELMNMKISKFGIIRDRVFEANLGLSDDLMQEKNIIWNDEICRHEPLVKSLETNIVDGCNLNCRGCSHFSNLFDRKDKVPFDIFCKDLRQIAEHIWIYRLNLLGGEALLDEHIIDYINYSRQILPDSEIYLISNGLLIPKQSPEFFECCRKNDILISVSGYKPTLILEDKIRRALEENKIIYSFRCHKEEFGKNIDLTGTADKYEAVRMCRESTCHFIRYGKIYKCPFEALGNRFFEHFNQNIRLDGGYDIYDTNLDWNMVVNNLTYEPVEACRYCGKEEKIEWDVANSPVLEDWVVKK